MVHIDPILNGTFNYTLCLKCGNPWCPWPNKGAHMLHRVKIWTGPALAVALTEKFHEAGLKAVTGMDHIYLTAKGSDEASARQNVLATLKQYHGTDFDLK